MSRLELHTVLPVSTNDPDGFSRGSWAPVASPDGPRGAHQVPGSSLHRAQHAARAAEVAALDGVVVPFDLTGDDALVVAAGALRASRWQRVVAEIHPAQATPVYAAKVSASLQRFSHERFGWSLVTETDEPTARAVGDRVEPGERLDRADEFLTVARGVWGSEDYSFEGRYYEVLHGGFSRPLAGRGFPLVVLRGRTDSALALSAKHADVHVVDLSSTPVDAHQATLADVGERLAGRADEHGRRPRLGVRVPVVTREDVAEATEAAARSLAPVGAVVGDPHAVAAALAAYRAGGVSHVELDLRPAVEETYRFGERVLPHVHERATTHA